MNQLSVKAYELRQHVLDIIVSGGGGHIGGDMSSMEIMLTLYSRMHISPDHADDPDRDRFVLSKGHCVETLYAVLADRGFMDLEEVKAKFSRFGSEYIGHPHNTLPGIEMNSGSLGHGLSVCVGMALAGKLDDSNGRVYVLLGDGELQEGIVWEAAMAAPNYGLDNLTAFVDWNKLQIDGRNEEVMKVTPIDEKFKAFGWNVITINGHDFDEIFQALDDARSVKGRPTVIIAETIKGKGVDFMEDQAGWHGKAPNDEEAAKAVEQLGGNW